MHNFSRNNSVREYNWKKPFDTIIRDCFIEWSTLVLEFSEHFQQVKNQFVWSDMLAKRLFGKRTVHPKKKDNFELFLTCTWRHSIFHIWGATMLVYRYLQKTWSRTSEKWMKGTAVLNPHLKIPSKTHKTSSNLSQH